ncbi:MAG: hypothetical protein CMH55_04285 [Myxococcales bacterium]|nr:hypothetical protein [Myxococcales bacterium]
MILFPALLFSVASPWSPPAAFQHSYVQRRSEKIEISAAPDFVVVKTASLKTLRSNLPAGVEVVAAFGHDGLVELRRTTPSLRGLLESLRPLQRRRVIQRVFPVWRRGVDGRAHVDDRVIFRLRRAADLAAVKALGLGDLRAARGLPLTWTAKAPDGDAVGTTNRFADAPAFVWIEPDWFFWPKPLWTPDDPLLERAWHLAPEGVAGLRAEAAWDRVRGAGVRVGVIDTGIQTDHPDLNVLAGYDVIGGDDDPSPECSAARDGRGRAEGCPNDARFMESHGTAVAGITAATGNNALGTVGVCPECLVLGVRMINRSAGRRRSHADAIRWLSDQRAAVVNNSWGPSVSRYFPFSLAEEEAFAYAAAGRDGLGTLFLYAAGNDHFQDTGINPYLTHPHSVAVSASTRQGDLACYSNVGPDIDVSAPSKGCFDGEGGLTTVDVAWVNGYTDNDYYHDMGGTSGACPVATGVAALIVAANPALNHRQVKLVLSASTQANTPNVDGWVQRGRSAALFERDDRGWSAAFGFGRVDALAAVELAEGFRQDGPCTDDCEACVDGRCAERCEQDADCPGRSRCVEVENGRACHLPSLDTSRVGAQCSDACETCVRSVATNGQPRDLCTALCDVDEDCPSGWACGEVPEVGRVCHPGSRGCGQPYDPDECPSGIRVTDDRGNDYCGCSCIPDEPAPDAAFCPDGFYCSQADCDCTREGPGGCVEFTCEATSRNNTGMLPACFPREDFRPPCAHDIDCGGGAICIEGTCADDPNTCRACSQCRAHDDCGEGGFCGALEGGRRICLIRCRTDQDCDGDSVCRAVNAGDGRVFEFCLNNPQETSEEICPEDYRCGSDIPRCDGDEDCPGPSYHCDWDGQCREGELRPRPEEPQLPGPEPKTEPPPASPSGCSCQKVPLVDGLVLLFVAALLRRRRAS